VTCMALVCRMDDFALFMQPIGVAMNLGRVLPQLAPVRGQLVEELLMCIEVERIFRQRLELALERPVLTHQLVVRFAQLRRKMASKSLFHIRHGSSRGQAHKYEQDRDITRRS
jgi:hypothetical protein